MALDIPKSGGGFNKDPNVVPMIDILLVLLIIFMMQIPLSRKVMDSQVPPAQQQNQQQPDTPSNNIVLELLADGSYAINNEPIALEQLYARFHEIYDNRPAKILFVKAAGNRKYKEVIDAMDMARGAGVQVLGFTPSEKSEGQ